MRRNRICLVILLLTILPASAAHAATLWGGPSFSYTQPAPIPSQAANQDRITSDIWLTRGSTQGLFNAFNETFYTHFSSPSGTEWAFGTLANYNTLTYKNWEAWHNANPPSTVNQDAVLHLIPDDIYLSIKFTAWGGSGGGFSYNRSTVPEPSSGAALGAITMAIASRRRRAQQYL